MLMFLKHKGKIQRMTFLVSKLSNLYVYCIFYRIFVIGADLSICNSKGIYPIDFANNAGTGY